VRRCVGRRLVRRYLIFCIVAVFIWFFSKDYLQSITYSINDLTSTLQIRKHTYSGYFNFIILFVVGILPLYAINSDVVNLFADSSFTFLAKLNMWLYLIYLSIWMNKYYFVRVKKNHILDEYVDSSPIFYKLLIVTFFGFSNEYYFLAKKNLMLKTPMLIISLWEKK
jgi:hypothetical protein